MRDGRYSKLLLKVVTRTAHACSSASLVIAIVVALSMFVMLSHTTATTAQAAGLTTATTASKQSPQCDRVSLLDHTHELQLLNSGIDLAISTGYLRKQLQAIDPTTLTNTSLEPSTLSLLDLEFRVAPFVHAMQIAGVATAVPQHVNVTSPTTAALGVALDGALRLNGTVRLTLEQLKRKWWQLCWTHFWHLRTCPPATLDVDVRVVVTQPSATASLELEMFQCPRSDAHLSGASRAQARAQDVSASTSVCHDITLRDVISAVLHRTLPALETRVRRRIQRLALTDVHVAFDALSDLSVRFHDSNALTRALLNALVRFSRAQVNRKGTSYRTLVALAAANVNASANAAIAQVIGDTASATCYDS